ncbi:hypothetical protein [Streptomyces sp. NPDC002769]|uniref:hypothetical protein n=1 Tax=Streptomyces sp. NPDC002769 TaxID=3154542 RepID=UPI00332D795B
MDIEGGQQGADLYTVDRGTPWRRHRAQREPSRAGGAEGPVVRAVALLAPGTANSPGGGSPVNGELAPQGH